MARTIRARDLPGEQAGHEAVGLDSMLFHECGLGPERATVDTIRKDVREVGPADLDGLDAVIHLAGQPGVRASWGEEFDVYLRENVLSTQRLLEAARSAGLQKFVIASSSSVYGQAERFPTLESDTPRPVSPYGVTKLAAEHLCHLYHTAFGVPVAMLRYFTVFGPRQRPDMAFHIFCRAALEGRPLTVFGDGRQTRDFTYVTNVVQANILAGTRPAEIVSGHPVNVGAGERTSLQQLASLIRDVPGRPLVCQSVAPRAGDVRDSLAGLERTKRLLGYEVDVGLREGLRRTWDWFRTSATSAEGAPRLSVATQVA